MLLTLTLISYSSEEVTLCLTEIARGHDVASATPEVLYKDSKATLSLCRADEEEPEGFVSTQTERWEVPIKYRIVRLLWGDLVLVPSVSEIPLVPHEVINPQHSTRPSLV